MTYEEILKNMDAEHWCRLEESEKLDFFQSLENHMALESGRIPCPVKGKWLYTGQEGIVLGTYNPKTNEIEVNISQFDEYAPYGRDPGRLTQTLLHEGRHALQKQVVEGRVDYPNEALALEWKENLDNYISYAKNPRAYYNQPVERDARVFAEQRYEALLKEKNAIENKPEKQAGVEVQEAAKIFKEQMESSNNKIAADYQIQNKIYPRM